MNIQTNCKVSLALRKVWYASDEVVSSRDEYLGVTYGDTDPAGRNMARPAVFIRPNETGNDEVACSHADSSSKQDRLATKLVDVEYSGDRQEELNHANNTGRQKRQGVTFKSEALEDEGCTERSGQRWLKIGCNAALTSS